MTAASLEIMLFRCQPCGSLYERRPVVCTGCLNNTFEEQSVPGLGTLAGWTTIRKPPIEHRGHGPYDVAVIDLSVGLRVTARIVSEADLKVGDEVSLTKQMEVAGQSVHVFEASR